MPKRPDINSVLVIGSGPIVIGQACEFDYSGTQACRVLQAEGIRVVLLNSNPATIMTDPEFADATYVEPITVEVIDEILAQEKPDAVLATLGGQTALNAAIACAEAGIFAKHNVELIGANLEAIHLGENRELFKGVVERCGAESAKSVICHSMEECLAAADELKYPVVVRPSFTMGGLGSGFAYNEDDLRRIAGAGLHYSPTHEVLLEESILGWKEFEFEMMRDRADNVITICSIENLDPVGVHTGDAVTVAPALTLTDREYQNLRDISIKIIREVGVDSGGCNIQFAVEPDTGRVVVIEMNPRVSRSSALASKATGYPIAKVAARVAIGYTLDEITNDLTGVTTAAAEPSIDYVVVKVPRFAFDKFPAADPVLTTTMKSVGEAMSLGATFTEALGKALRSLDKPGLNFHWQGAAPAGAQLAELLEAIQIPTEQRLVQVQQVLRSVAAGAVSIADVYAATGIDPYFLTEIMAMNQVAAQIQEHGVNSESLRLAKQTGLADEQIAALVNVSVAQVFQWRQEWGIQPQYRQVDTVAGTLPAQKNYYYSSYAVAAEANEVKPRDRAAVLILGSGPNRIGQGIEFDYSCVHAALALSEQYETVMVNCNPETVSTDYDTADRLYFEPLTFEDVMAVYAAESAVGPVAGVLVQLGGQTPLSLAQALADAGVKILGTSPAAIDKAEDRAEFGKVLAAAQLPAPAYGTANDIDSAREIAGKLGYPVLVRPSYVLGGRGMEIVYDDAQLADYGARMATAGLDFAAAPLLVDRFLDDAIEIDVDALYDGQEIFLGGVMEHIEEAGVHSGDSSCVLPPLTLSDAELQRIAASTAALAAGIGVRGLINVQFALLSDVLYVLEANPRASRTVPFVAKATGVPIAKAAARIMLGETIAQLRADGTLPAVDARVDNPNQRIAVKEAVLPFKRFRTRSGQVVDAVLGPEMRSTGEVMGYADTFPMAFAKSQAAATSGLPTSGRAFVSLADRDKRAIAFPAARLHALGFEILATAGTARVLARHGIPAQIVRKHSEGTGPGGEPTIVELINNREIDLVVNTPSGQGSRVDGYEIRAASTAADIPIVTTTPQFAAAVEAIDALQHQRLEVRSLQASV